MKKKILIILMLLVFNVSFIDGISANTFSNQSNVVAENDFLSNGFDDLNFKEASCKDIDEGMDDYEIKEFNKENNLSCQTSLGKRTPKILLIVVIWFLFCLVTRLLFNIKKQKMIKPVEFYAPDGKDPLEIGYYADGNIDDKDIVAMFFYFAQKGYLKFEEANKNVRLIKVNDISDDEPQYAKKLFNMMFYNDNTVFDPKDIRIQFAQNYQGLKEEIVDEIEKEKPLYTELSKVAKSFCLIGTFITIVIIGFTYSTTSNRAFSSIFITDIFFMYYGAKKLVEYKDATNKNTRKRNLIIWIVATLIFAIFLEIFANLENAINGLGLLMGIILSITILIALDIRKFNPEYLEIIGRAQGFKKFLQDAEMDRFNALFEENPHYYFDILPYIYAFGLSDKFIEKLDYLEILNSNWMDNLDTTNDLNEFVMFTQMNTEMLVKVSQFKKIKKY